MHNSSRPDAVLGGSTRCLDSSQRHLMLDSDVPEYGSEAAPGAVIRGA